MSQQFLVLAALMAIAALGFVLSISRVWRRDVDGESNLDWLRLRQEELSGAIDQDSSLITDAELRVLQELSETAEAPDRASVELSAAPGRTEPRTSRRLMVALALVVLIVPGLVYVQVGALEDVRITNAIAELDESAPEGIDALMAAIEARSRARPDNADYLSLLGQFYTGTENHGAALETYERLLTLYPESAEILARAAQAEYLANDRKLSAQARRRAESALASDPNQRTALGTLGIAAFEREDYGLAIDYWQRLLAFEVPGTPGYQMMTGVIAEARSRGGVGSPSAAPVVVAGSGVSVTVQAPEGANIAPDATVFVLARPQGAAQRMPTAVQRRQASELPLTVRLDDASAMAGQQISTLAAVSIEVQVSPDGRPGRSGATWLATADNVIPSEAAAVTLVLRPVTP